MTSEVVIGLGVKLDGRRDHDATGDQHVGNRHAGRQIKASEPAKRLVPAAIQQRVGHQKRHVDADRRGGRRDHHVALLEDTICPTRSVGRFRQRLPGPAISRLDCLHWVKSGTNPARIAAQSSSPLVPDRHHDAKETDDDHADQALEKPIEDLGRQPGRLFRNTTIRRRQRNRRPTRRTSSGPYRREQLAKPTRFLPQRLEAEAELRHAPDHVGHAGGDQPSPAEHRIDVLIDRLKRTLTGRERDVTDGRRASRRPSRSPRNCSHSRLVPPRHPRNKAPASEPPPSVIALCNHPGPDRRM